MCETVVHVFTFKPQLQIVPNSAEDTLRRFSLAVQCLQIAICYSEIHNKQVFIYLFIFLHKEQKSQPKTTSNTFSG